MNDDLDTLRARLDTIDRRLLETIEARLRCCEEIGRFKKAHGVAMMQPQRVGLVKNRAADFARERGLSDAFFLQLYDLIVAETCRLEDLIIHG